MKREVIKKVIVVMTLIVSIGVANVKNVYGVTKIIRQSWNLVDSVKHLDWDGSTVICEKLKII